MLQFGEPDPALDYIDRPTAFGLQLLVAGDVAGRFLDLAAHVLGGAFDSVMIGHGCYS